MPASPSLWYHHASWLALEGFNDEAVNRSLLLSYQYGGREGWLAPRRLVFGLARWSHLPEGLRGHVEMDVWIMLQSWTQLKTLVLLYNSHPALRDQLVEIVERQATSEQKSTFAWLVEKVTKGEPLP